MNIVGFKAILVMKWWAGSVHADGDTRIKYSHHQDACTFTSLIPFLFFISRVS